MMRTLTWLLLIAWCAPAQTSWKAGVARIKVTPTESIWMAGYAARTKPSESVLKDLHVKALALQDETGKTSVLVTSDIIGFRKVQADIIAERCSRQFGLSRDRLVLNSSHTHSGPMIGSFSSSRPGFEAQADVVKRYTESLLDKVTAVVGESIKNLAPANLTFEQGLAGFAVNRRRVRLRSLPGPVDHDVPVIAVRNPDGSLKAVVFGYACHNTTLGAYYINADYAGFAQESLESTYPGAVALFVLGCGADSNPLPRYHGTKPELERYSVELASMYGKILAAAVDIVLRDARMKPLGGPLKTTFEMVELPFRVPGKAEFEARLKDSNPQKRGHAERMLKILERDGKLPSGYPNYPVQVWRFGSGLKFIALGGEVVVDFAVRLKGEHGWDDTWVAGYSNDVFAYIPSLRILKEGGYEGGDAMQFGSNPGPFGAAVEEIVVEKVQELIARTAP